MERSTQVGEGQLTSASSPLSSGASQRGQADRTRLQRRRWRMRAGRTACSGGAPQYATGAEECSRQGSSPVQWADGPSRLDVRARGPRTMAWDMIGSPEQARSTTRGTPRLACTALLASRWVGGVTAPELNRSCDGADGAGLGVNRAGRGSRRRRTDRTRGVRRRGLGGGVSVGVIALVVKAIMAPTWDLI